MTSDLETGVLKGVSRSFYLTLRLLPAPMRRAASLGYLLARTSDTLADTAAAPLEERLGCLDAYGEAVAGETPAPDWPLALVSSVTDPRELLLLERADEVLDGLRGLPAGEAALVREVVDIIIGGQKLDLVRFARASADTPVSLPDDDALEDYAWRVAGCVGAFWTKLGFLTLGGKFSTLGEAELLEKGIAYGKGLQLVNILRDLPADLSAGRAYLPVDPSDRGALMACHASWVKRAREWVEQGVDYAESLPSRRLRAATLLPALIVRETLERLESADWDALQTRVKVPRGRVYTLLFKSLLS